MSHGHGSPNNIPRDKISPYIVTIVLLYVAMYVLTQPSCKRSKGEDCAGKFAVVFIAALLLSGCATPNIDLSAENRDRLHSIVVLEVNEPQEVSIINISPMFGGLVQAAINASHTTTYANMLVGKGQVFAPTLTNYINNGLATDGYHVVKLDNQKVAAALADKPEGYADIHTDADAILNVWFIATGYVSPPLKVDYIPLMLVNARLLDAKTKQDLFFKTYTCSFGKRPNDVHIDNYPLYHYGTFEVIEHKFDQSVDGIKSCETSIAKVIAQSLAHDQ